MLKIGKTQIIRATIGLLVVASIWSAYTYVRISVNACCQMRQTWQQIL